MVPLGLIAMAVTGESSTTGSSPFRSPLVFHRYTRRSRWAVTMVLSGVTAKAVTDSERGMAMWRSQGHFGL